MTRTEHARHANRCRGKGGTRPGKNPLTSSVIYSDDQWEFMQAMAAFQKLYRCRQPTCRDILSVIRELGYRLVEPPR